MQEGVFAHPLFCHENTASARIVCVECFYRISISALRLEGFRSTENALPRTEAKVPGTLASVLGRADVRPREVLFLPCRTVQKVPRCECPIFFLLSYWGRGREGANVQLLLRKVLMFAKLLFPCKYGAMGAVRAIVSCVFFQIKTAACMINNLYLLLVFSCLLRIF